MTDYPTPDPAAPESTAADAPSPAPAAADAPAAPDAAAAAETAAPQDDQHADLPEPGARNEALAALERERDEFKDLLLRKTAEFDNYRRRVERERRDLIELANADLVTAILPLIDNFERALQAPNTGTAEAYRQGVELIYKQLLDVLGRYGVVAIDPLGADFDPHVHEAVAREIDPARRDGEIVEVFARGYQMRDRLLRPARVKVVQS